MFDAHFLGSAITALAILIVLHQLIRLAMVAMLHRTLRQGPQAGVTGCAGRGCLPPGNSAFTAAFIASTMSRITASAVPTACCHR